MNYNKELDQLFIEWETKAKELGYNKFCRDGLLYKGEIWNQTREDNKVYWGRFPGDEDNMWHNSNNRICFLMKDTNNNPNDDSREWLGRQDETKITHQFFKNIALWLTGLNSFNSSNDYLPFEKANNVQLFSKEYDDKSFAIINCKKESGSGSINNDTLFEHSKTFNVFLKKQMDILNPNIIVCGGGSGAVLDIARNIIFPELEFTKINSWIYYNKETNKVLIDSYHPSNRKGYEDVYTCMMDAYKEYLNK